MECMDMIFVTITVMGNHDITIGYRHHHDYRERLDNGISENIH